MRRHRFVILGLGLLAASAVSIGTFAQTTAVGPYYATPSWDQKIACTSPSTCPRFVVLSNWNSEAVLDRETGLVWEQSPSAVPVQWNAAYDLCLTLSKGNRQGWRLPTFSELASLVELPSDALSLPPGHPFNNVQSSSIDDRYWSATWRGTDSAYGKIFLGDGFFSAPRVGFLAYYWCVRGGQGVNNK